MSRIGAFGMLAARLRNLRGCSQGDVAVRACLSVAEIAHNESGEAPVKVISHVRGLAAGAAESAELLAMGLSEHFGLDDADRAFLEQMLSCARIVCNFRAVLDECALPESQSVSVADGLKRLIAGKVAAGTYGVISLSIVAGEFGDAQEARAWYEGLMDFERVAVDGDPFVVTCALLPDGVRLDEAWDDERGRPRSRCAPRLWRAFLTRVARSESISKAYRETQDEAAADEPFPSSKTCRRWLNELDLLRPEWRKSMTVGAYA